MPYMLYDSVQYLLFSGVKHELADYYASLTATPRDPRTAFPVFRSFCMEHKDQIVRLIETRLNQTNEIGRIAAILPALGEVQRRGGGRPIALVEIGPSGGLLLCFDRYLIDYGAAQWGDPTSKVRIICELEDGIPPPLQPGVPTVGYRVGLDIEPVDLTDDDQANWLSSSMWPDHRDLALRQRAAIEELRKDPPRLVQGSCIEIQPLLDEVPPDLTLCVLQSYVFQHVPKPDIETFMEIMAREGRRRPVYMVSMNGDRGAEGVRRARVDIEWWVNGDHGTEKLAEVHSRGRSMRWVGPR
jgi:hypothetical protein